MNEIIHYQYLASSYSLAARVDLNSNLPLNAILHQQIAAYYYKKCRQHLGIE